jgi:aminoglycoside phosphotransferase (APT) family kinase protein
MRPELDVDALLRQAAAELGHVFQDWRRPDAGADHVIVLVTTAKGERLVIKAGPDAAVDAFVLARLAGRDVNVPTLIAQAPLADRPDAGSLIVMTEVAGTLLADVDQPAERYLRPLIEQMRNVHAVTTTAGAGPVLAVEHGARQSWRDYLVYVLTGQDPEFRWSEIARHPAVDGGLLTRALDAAVVRARELSFPATLSLLHGDLNPYNVFVHDGEISGIIDWSYARYGDPLFDFARLRMNPFVRANPSAVQVYRAELSLTPDSERREAFYYVVNLLEYGNWYFLYGELARVTEQLTLIATEMECGVLAN